MSGDWQDEPKFKAAALWGTANNVGYDWPLRMSAAEEALNIYARLLELAEADATSCTAERDKVRKQLWELESQIEVHVDGYNEAVRERDAAQEKVNQAEYRAMLADSARQEAEAKLTGNEAAIQARLGGIEQTIVDILQSLGPSKKKTVAELTVDAIVEELGSWGVGQMGDGLEDQVWEHYAGEGHYYDMDPTQRQAFMNEVSVALWGDDYTGKLAGDGWYGHPSRKDVKP